MNRFSSWGSRMELGTLSPTCARMDPPLGIYQHTGSVSKASLASMSPIDDESAFAYLGQDISAAMPLKDDESETRHQCQHA
jgi:hypothetical protein